MYSSRQSTDPVFHGEFGKTSEMAFVVGHERAAVRGGDGGNQQVGVIQPNALAFEVGFPASKGLDDRIGGVED